MWSPYELQICWETNYFNYNAISIKSPHCICKYIHCSFPHNRILTHLQIPLTPFIVWNCIFCRVMHACLHIIGWKCWYHCRIEYKKKCTYRITLNNDVKHEWMSILEYKFNNVDNILDTNKNDWIRSDFVIFEYTILRNH